MKDLEPINPDLTLAIIEIISERTVESCDACGGACCSMLITDGWPPFDYSISIDRHRLLVKMSIELAKEVQKLEETPIRGPCQWLTAEGRCKHYEHRPQKCRDFTVGNHNCLMARRVHKVRELTGGKNDK